MAHRQTDDSRLISARSEEKVEDVMGALQLQRNIVRLKPHAESTLPAAHGW